VRSVQNCISGFIHSIRYSYQILMKPELYHFSTGFGNILKFHENLSSRSRVITCERTDGQTWRS